MSSLAVNLNKINIQRKKRGVKKEQGFFSTEVKEKAKGLSRKDLYLLYEFDLLDSDNYQDEIKKIRAEHIPERVEALINPVQRKKGFFKCRRCKSENTEVYEVPSTSTDEGSYQHIVCMDCGTQSASR